MNNKDLHWKSTVKASQNSPAWETLSHYEDPCWGQTQMPQDKPGYWADIAAATESTE